MAENLPPTPGQEEEAREGEREQKLEIARQQQTGREAEQQQISQSYWSLVWWKFKKNKLAIVGGIIVVLFYFTCFLFPEFFAPYRVESESQYIEVAPMRPHFRDAEGNWRLRPFVYGLEKQIDLETRKRSWDVDKTQVFPLHFFVEGEEYKILGLITWNRHLYGTDPEDPEAYAYLLGTDTLGRDQVSRIFYGGRISLSIGLVGVFITLAFGATMGAASGYYGGAIDTFVQRTTEFLSAFPDIPLFMALAAAIPVGVSPILVYFMLTIILAFVRWGGLARQVRGLVLSLREREYVLAAQSFGAGDRRILFRHLIPGALSHIIVIASLMVPSMILSEVALSWLGLGIRPPMTSWGVMLQEGGNIRALNYTPWLLFPILVVMLVVLAYNMLGDGLRDATDPYGGR
jgi:peptide/nickel transport system permease protein